jgi:hypothetical protein
MAAAFCYSRALLTTWTQTSTDPDSLRGNKYKGPPIAIPEGTAAATCVQMASIQLIFSDASEKLVDILITYFERQLSHLRTDDDEFRAYLALVAAQKLVDGLDHRLCTDLRSILFYAVRSLDPATLAKLATALVNSMAGGMTPTHTTRHTSVGRIPNADVNAFVALRGDIAHGNDVATIPSLAEAQTHFNNVRAFVVHVENQFAAVGAGPVGAPGNGQAPGFADSIVVVPQSKAPPKCLCLNVHVFVSVLCEYLLTIRGAPFPSCAQRRRSRHPWGTSACHTAS